MDESNRTPERPARQPIRVAPVAARAGAAASDDGEPIGTAVGIVGLQLPFLDVMLLVFQVTIAQAIIAGAVALVLIAFGVI
jgi:hypothetical protein